MRNGFTAKLIARNLEPGNTYRYELYINETKYDRPGKPYGGGYEILDLTGKEKRETRYH